MNLFVKFFIVFIAFGLVAGVENVRAENMVAISGKVINNSGQGIPNVAIELCGTAANPVTDANGNWSAAVPNGASYCARIASGLPVGYGEIKGTTNIYCHTNSNSYEWQIAGQEKFQSCAENDWRSWDLAVDNRFNFVINYPGTLEIDTLDYFVTKHLDKALTGSHAISQNIFGNESYYLKFATPDKWFEYHIWDDDYIYLKEDTGGYTFNPGYWMKRWMKVGETIDAASNVFLRYDNNIDCNYKVPTPEPFRYKNTLIDHIADYNAGGDLGIQDVIVLKYDWVGEYEVFYYSKEWGWIRWENYTAGGVLKAEAIFNKIDINPPVSVYANNLCLKREEYKKQFPNLICTPGSFKDCKICNSNGSAWINGDSKCVEISGNVANNSNQPIPNVKIAISGYSEATVETDTNGEWSVFMMPSMGHSVRIDSGLPVGYKSIVANNNRSCNVNAGSYEWQQVGRNEFKDCTKGEVGSWDLDHDNKFDFIINYPVCAANEITGCKICNADGLSWKDDNSKCAANQTCQKGVCTANCLVRTCAAQEYVCGNQSDGCGSMINCGICASGQICNASGQCVSSSNGGGGTIIKKEEPKPVAKITRAEIIAKINEIVALIAKLQVRLKAMTGQNYSCTQITKNLYYGTKNDPQVKCLQEVLKAQGFVVTVSGNYDLATKNAVIKFQQKYTAEILTPYGLRYGSGNAGNATKNKLNQIIGGK